MGFFDFNNPEHQSLSNSHQTGTSSGLSADQLLSHYSGFVQNSPPEEIDQVHQEYFDKMPRTKQMSLFGDVVGALTQQGIDPRQAGIQTTNPQQASSSDLGNLFNFIGNSGLLGGAMGAAGGQMAQPGGGGMGNLIGGLLGGGQQAPQYGSRGGSQQYQGGSNGIQGLLSNPLFQTAISGLVGYAANRAINNFANRGPQGGQASLPGYSNQGNTAPNSGTSGIYQGPGGASALPGFEQNGRSGQ